MYLITVAVAEEEGRPGPLPLADLAQSLAISPVSANQMVRRLEERGLVEYHPYHGVALTPPGGRRPGGCCGAGACGPPSWWTTWASAPRKPTPSPAAWSTSLRPRRPTAWPGSWETRRWGPLGRPIPPLAATRPSAGRARP